MGQLDELSLMLGEMRQTIKDLRNDNNEMREQHKVMAVKIDQIASAIPDVMKLQSQVKKHEKMYQKAMAVVSVIALVVSATASDMFQWIASHFK